MDTQNNTPTANPLEVAVRDLCGKVDAYLKQGCLRSELCHVNERVKALLNTIPDAPNHLEEALELVTEYNLKPYRDGNAWCILLGKDIQSGICGFGDTLTKTYLDFLKAYKEYKHPIGELLNDLPQQPVKEPEYYQHFDPDC